MKKIQLVISTILLLVLCGCSGVGMRSTYWRNDDTGEWLIGLTEDNVIYDCKVWDIASKNESDGVYSIEAQYGSERLDISVGSEQGAKRTITIGDKQFDCSIIDGHFLSDYPEKDTCVTIADNHYAAGDSVTIVGWVKQKSGIFGFAKSKKNGKEVAVTRMANILTGEEPTFTAPIDSLGRFVLRIPIENTTSFCLKVGQETQEMAAEIVAEPNETYFLMIDKSQDKTLFMGKNARLQNEINAHRILTPEYDATKLKEIGSMMSILDSIRNNTKATLQKLEDICGEHPTLSERYHTYYRNYIMVANAQSLMQGMHIMPNNELPTNYSKAVDEVNWKEFCEPYTMNAYAFSLFLNDYVAFLQTKVEEKVDHTMTSILEAAEKDGVVKLSTKDREAIRQYDEAYPAYLEQRENAPDSIQKAMDEEFGNNNYVKAVLEIQGRNPKYDEYALQKNLMRNTEQMVKEVNARRLSKVAKDIILCRYLYSNIDRIRKPLYREIIDFVNKRIRIPAARNVVHTINDKYEQICNDTIDNRGL